MPYKITASEKQARLIQVACELMGRLLMGGEHQEGIVADIMENMKGANRFELFNIEEVIRHRLFLDNGGTLNSGTVSSYPPTKMCQDELILIEKQ